MDLPSFLKSTPSVLTRTKPCSEGICTLRELTGNTGRSGVRRQCFVRSGSAVRPTGKRVSGGAARERPWQSLKHNVDASRGAASSQGGDGMTDVFNKVTGTSVRGGGDEVTPPVARAGRSRSCQRRGAFNTLFWMSLLGDFEQGDHSFMI